MTDDTPTPAPEYTGEDHGFGEDNAIADQIKSMDWYADNPSAHNTSRMGWSKWELPTSVESLSPEMAAPINKRLAGLTPEQRAEREPALVREALVEASKDARILTGLGDGATPFAKAQVSLAYREQELARRIADWQSQLEEVTGNKAVTDPTTGQQTMQPVYRLTGEGRHKATLQVQELTRQLAVLKGPEGDRELEEALRESVEQVKGRRDQRAKLDEIERRTQEQMREDEINAAVAVQVKHRRGSNNYSASL